MIKKCVMCGKDFEPRYNLAKRQICCSKECSAARGKAYSDARQADPIRWRAYLDREKELRKQRIKPQKCLLCGKDVIPDGYFHKGHHVKLHDECVFEDCLKVLESGMKLNHKQAQRLAARGYTVSEFTEEYIGKPDWRNIKVGMICLD